MRGLWFLLWRSWWNRLRLQFRRLRQPQYLIGTLFGLAYLWFFLVRPGAHGHGGSTGGPGWSGPSVAAANLGLLEAGVACGLLAAAFLTWFLPVQRAALPLTEGEVAFLFPAPVSRRTLVRFHLVRAQFGLLFTAVIMVLVWRRRATGWDGAVLGLAGWWLFMVMLELHRQAAAFGRTWLANRGLGPWRRRGVLLALLAAFLAAETLWLVPRLPAFTPEFWASTDGLKDLAQTAAEGGPLGGLLWLVRPLVRPLLASETTGRLIGLAAQAVFCGLLYAVLMRLDVPFEEETLLRSQQRSQAIALVRSGNWHLAGRPAKARRPWFRLRPTGAPWVGLCWKNLIAVRGLFGSTFLWLFLGCLLLPFLLPLLWKGGTVALGLAMVLVAVSPILFLMGPHILRCDLRQDLNSLDLLKPLPLRGWQVLLGEVLAPVTILTVVQWGVLVPFALLGAVVGLEEGRLPPEVLAAGVSVMLAVAAFLPAFNAMSVLLLNGAAVLFPAWLRSGPGINERGFGAMGSQLLLVLGHLVGLFAALIVPGAIGAGVGFGLFAVGLRWEWSVPPAAGVAALLLLAEVAGGLLMLGDRFERLDLGDDPAV